MVRLDHVVGESFLVGELHPHDIHVVDDVFEADYVSPVHFLINCVVEPRNYVREKTFLNEE